MMDRRDILKRFGIGAIIVPVIGGAAATTSAVELIEVPKVRPVELFTKIPEPLALSKIKKVTLTLEYQDGKTRSIATSRNPFSSGLIKPTDTVDLFIQFSSANASPAKTVGEIYGQVEL